MCDSRSHTLGGNREDSGVNISHSRHSTDCYYTKLLSAVCACTCLFQSPSSPAPLTAGSPPSLAFGRQSFISSAWHLLRMLFLTPFISLYLCDIWIYGRVRPPYQTVYFPWSSYLCCNVIFCLSASGSSSVWSAVIKAAEACLDTTARPAAQV